MMTGAPVAHSYTKKYFTEKPIEIIKIAISFDWERLNPDRHKNGMLDQACLHEPLPALPSPGS